MHYCMSANDFTSKYLCLQKPVEECPFRELFFWAVLNGMHKMAMYLWEFEEEGLIKALIAAEINNKLAEKAASTSNLQDDIENSFRSSARYK